MKNQIYSILLLAASSTLSFGQCNQDVTITASKTEYLDGSGVIQRTVDEQSTIQIKGSQIIITPGSADHQMTGTIESTTCDWSTPYKEGKTVSKAVFEDPSREQRHVTLTTEGKGGKVTFLMEIDEMPDKKIRVSVVDFQETKKE
ncbi:hypothetical protein [Salmonirosea aquatica]|uniref:Lipocalin-like domain-containing protein n=1 Tax=Salmonirosea aquatica TaxID=2654236 RepID=A0A7C9BI57_9BACT|nr:hypothetical protein [Cytophagaceae bacterium SJW1-29]